MWKQYYVYVVSNAWLTIYIGVTNSLERRINEHRSGAIEGFTSRYQCDRLVYYEEFADINQAIAREKQLKGWKRFKKIALIRDFNPEWKDLSQE